MSQLRLFALALAATLLVTNISQAQFRVYNNIDGSVFSGFVYSNGGDGPDPVTTGNTITRLTADDIHFAPGFAGNVITNIYFSVSNLNAVAVSARPRLRFYADNSNSPGNILAAFTFNPISFPAQSVSVFFFNPGGSFTVPAGTMWAGETFDDNVGTTGITPAQLNNLGQGIFGPPQAGTSLDEFFQSTSQGSFNQNNPPGSLLFFGGVPAANFGWAFEIANISSVPEPATWGLLILGTTACTGGLVYRRRKARLAAEEKLVVKR
jgi:hypothetical protein